MATHVSKDYSNDLPHGVKLPGEVAEASMNEIKLWLSDDSKPGNYTISGMHHNAIDRGHAHRSFYDNLEFRFADEDVAFEFKLRWA